MKTENILMVALLLLPVLSIVPKSQHPCPNCALAGKTDTTAVRGVSFQYFKSSVTDFSDTSSKKKWLDTSWTLWKENKWPTLDSLFNNNKLNSYPRVGGLSYPPVAGGMDLQWVKLDSGTLIDRYGGSDTTGVFRDNGKFVSPKGTSYTERALPPGSDKKPYRVYLVIKTIDSVKRGEIAPWFNQRGKGIQYEMRASIDSLLRWKWIVEISSTPPK
jgi:hypothetical protein